MDSEIKAEKSWLKRNWKWFVPFSGLILICLFLTSSNLTGITDIAQTFADSSICQNAINKANNNEAVIKSLGKLESIDNIAIMEGNCAYSNNNKNVEITVRVSGEKGKGKMDISAEKSGENWQYKNIKIRIKKTDEEIIVK